MAEQSISKRCSNCKQIRPISEFCKDRRRKDGLYSDCKICHKLSTKKYDQSDKGKESHRKRLHKYKLQYPEQVKAQKAVNNAIRAGKMPRPDSLKCACGNPAKQYHHPSYESEYWFHVIPVCISCHKKLNQSRIIA